MTIKKATGLAAFALVALALASNEAAAQATTVSATVSGNAVSITWTPIAGAQGYQAEVNYNGTTYTVPTTLPYLNTTAAPNGSYMARVRGVAGSVAGPWSNIVSFTVPTTTAPPPPPPGGTCTAPTLSATASGLVITFSWGVVPGATSGQLLVGRAPGVTEQIVPVNNTSYQAFAPGLGTYYATLVVSGSCGTLRSNEVAVQVTQTSGGSGPRTPDPAPGQRLPLPSYGAAIAQQMAAAYRGDLNNSCVEHGGNNVWMYRLLQALRQRDSRWGLNWKRGNRGDLSQDIVAYNYGSGPDEDTTNVYIIDIIGGHCGNRPSWNWQDQTQATRDAGAIGRWTLTPYLRAGFPPDQR